MIARKTPLKKIVRKGVSEMLALVLGVVISIGIGVALFTILTNYVTSMTQQQRIAVTYLSANKISTTDFVLTLGIKNLGSKDINSLTINILINGSNPSSITPISPSTSQSCTQQQSNVIICNLVMTPGQEASIVLRITAGQPIKVGMPVTVIITARYVDGTSASATVSTTIM